MQDRVPSKPNRYAVYDDDHNFIRYEYHERADEPTQVGDALNKANLLDDNTCAALGLPTTSVPNDAFMILSIGDNRGLVVVTVYETGTTTPIQNVAISGITGADGEEVFTNANGIASGYTATALTTISVNSEYADLTVTPLTVDTPLGRRTYVTIYATRKVGADVTVSTSRYVRFTDKVLVDVHVVGGGMNGENYSKESNGGDGGKHKYLIDINPDPFARYLATVGAANGGASSFMGADSSAGSVGGWGGKSGRYISYTSSYSSATAGGANTIKKYGTGTTTFAGGGGGGGQISGGGFSDEMPGGSPYGGRGSGTPMVNNRNGYPATGLGGGGGGGYYGNAGTGGNGGAGYQGAVFYRWRYAA